jgi:hypothetical protein
LENGFGRFGVKINQDRFANSDTQTKQQKPKEKSRNTLLPNEIEAQQKAIESSDETGKKE